jgi:hypothetical protein
LSPARTTAERRYRARTILALGARLAWLYTARAVAGEASLSIDPSAHFRHKIANSEHAG